MGNRTPCITLGVVNFYNVGGCPCGLNPPMKYTESPAVIALPSVLGVGIGELLVQNDLV
jgi:hypothetical protein